MKTGTKIALIIAVSLIIVGITVFTTAMFTLDFDFSKLNTTEYTTNTYEYTDLVKNIEVDLETTDITILPASDDEIKVVCFEDEESTHNVFVENNILKIDSPDKKWFEYISIGSFEHAKISLYIPDGNYSTLTVENSTGDITISDLAFSDKISADCDTGDIYISNVMTDLLDADTTTGHLTIENIAPTVNTETTTSNSVIVAINPMDIEANATTGSITFQNVTVGGNITAKASTGDVKFENTKAKDLNVKTSTGDITFNKSDAKNIYAKASTGDVTGTILTAKTFNADSSTGKITVPATTGDGVFEVKTSTGEINISCSDN